MDLLMSLLGTGDNYKNESLRRHDTKPGFKLYLYCKTLPFYLPRQIAVYCLPGESDLYIVYHSEDNVFDFLIFSISLTLLVVLTIGDWSVVLSCGVVGWGAAALSSERS